MLFGVKGLNKLFVTYSWPLKTDFSGNKTSLGKDYFSIRCEKHLKQTHTEVVRVVS